MKTLDISVKVIKNQSIRRLTKSFNVNEPLTVENIKNMVKGEIEFPFEMVKEEFYYMSKELKDTDIIPFKSGNEFILTIK